MDQPSQALATLWRRARHCFLALGTRSSGEAAGEVDPKLSILEERWGHRESLRRLRPVDGDGDYLPWYTYPAIEYLRQLNFSDARLFEWGSGYSSLFWSKRCREIISVERSAEWHREISSAAPPNLNLLHIDEDPQYADAILEYGTFDVIVIDGSQRLNCIYTARQCLRDGGMIILDNSDWYSVAAARLRKYGLAQVDFCGFGPVNNYTWATSIYLQGHLNFSTLDERQPARPVGSLNVDAEEEAGLTATDLPEK